MKFIIAFVIAISLLVFLNVFQFPARGAGEGSIRGWVFDAHTREPITGAKVSYSGGEGVKGEVATDKEGKFRIDNLPPGAYILRVERDGYITRGNLPVIVVKGGEALIDIMLKKEGKGKQIDWEEVIKRRPIIHGIYIDFNPHGKPIGYKLDILSESLRLNGKEMSLKQILAELDEAKRSGRLERTSVLISVDDSINWEKAAAILCEVSKRKTPTFLPETNLPSFKRGLIGLVVDSKDKGIPEVKVEIYDEWMPDPTAALVKIINTDSKGCFELNYLGEGLYRIALVKEGYARSETLVYVTPRAMMRGIERKILMFKNADELPKFEYSPPFPLELPRIEQPGNAPAIVHPIVYIGADGKIAIDSEMIDKPDITTIYNRLSDEPSMFWTIIAADRRAKWKRIAEVLTEEMMRGMVSVFLMVEVKG